MTPLYLCPVAVSVSPSLLTAVGQTPVRGGKWAAIGLCALAAVLLLIVIAAMIPGKRK